MEGSCGIEVVVRFCMVGAPTAPAIAVTPLSYFSISNALGTAEGVFLYGD